MKDLRADTIPGVSHPRETQVIYGHEKPQEEFLSAFNAGALHHGWLVSGPSGIGKASLCYRFAKFLLSQDDGPSLFGPKTIDDLVAAQLSPEGTRVLAESEPRLLTIRRSVDEKTKKLRKVISVDDIRNLQKFFGLSAADGGHRVVIVDAADDMNPNAANAILKFLEEPPKDAIIFLIAHQPSRLLPTIRSRCRQLICKPLDPSSLEQAFATASEDPEISAGLHVLADGSVGRAVQMATSGGEDMYQTLVKAFSTTPFDRLGISRFGDTLSGVKNAERLHLFADVFDIFLSRLTKSSVTAADGIEAFAGERSILTRLNPAPHCASAWSETGHSLSERLRHGIAVNLDPSALVMDTMIKIETFSKRFQR